MTEHPNPQQQRQKLERYQEQLLQQYSELFEESLEATPLLQVFGGARTLTELHHAYKTLRKAWHPDISPYSESETNARFHWLKQAYSTLINNWSRFDPQNREIPASRIEKLKSQHLQWTSESFWYWQSYNAEVTS